MKDERVEDTEDSTNSDEDGVDEDTVTAARVKSILMKLDGVDLKDVDALYFSQSFVIG